MKDVLRSQYLASLTMLQRAIEACDEALWLDPSYKHPFWRVAYHTLFFSDLYLSETVEKFIAWDKHIDELESLGPMIHRGGKLPKEGPSYCKADLLTYCALILNKISPSLDPLELEAPSGFPWLSFGKLELQIYNIRHIQHHAGQLIERIRQGLDKPVDWIGSR